MVLLTILLSFMMIAINWTNYISITNNIDRVIDDIVGDDGDFPFEAKFFIAEFDSNSDKPTFDDKKSRIFISDELKEEIAVKTYYKKKDTGFLDKFRYRKITKDSSLSIIFVDTEMRLELIDNFYRISIYIIFIGLSLCLFMLFFLSKIVILPIKENEAKQKQFLTDASHELKTPLTIISANNELQELINGSNEMTYTITKEVKKMNHMVKDISELSKMTEDSILNKNTVSHFCISNSLIDICYEFVNSFKTKKIDFQFHISENIFFKGNELKIRELFSIILDNALKYSKSKCIISLFIKNNDILIYQRNDSDHVKEGKMNEIFSRFYRSKEARASDVEGSGIGLSIAKEITTIHKGRIEAYGDRESFFNIVVYLPLSRK